MKRLLSLLIVANSFSVSSCQEKMNKYDWKPTECAPVNYPAQIYKGNFYYGDKGRIDIPDGREINYGWGEDGSLNIAGDRLKEAPHTLELTWISFTENKNYTGKFELDTKKIDALLAEGYPDDAEPDGKGTYQTIKVGMAPGGDIALWLSGSRSKQVEIGYFKAQPAGELDWKKVYPAMDGTIDKYVNTIVNELSPEVKEQIKNKSIPVNYWAGLRKHYNWKPVLVTAAKVTKIDFDYFNKERDFFFGDRLKNMSYKPTAVVEELSVYWLDNKERELRTEIKFSEEEAFALFAKIQQNEQAELVITIDKDKQDAGVKLKIKDKEFPFSQIKVNSFYR